jgi:hypothetical protein
MALGDGTCAGLQRFYAATGKETLNQALALVQRCPIRSADPAITAGTPIITGVTTGEVAILVIFDLLQYLFGLHLIGFATEFLLQRRKVG